MTDPTRTATDQMSSSGFVAYATEVARKTTSWDEAGHAFSGPARWDPPAEVGPAVIGESPGDSVLAPDRFPGTGA